jgi:hypothetical protein
MRTRHRNTLSTLALALLAAACGGDSNNSLGPQFEPGL